MKNLEQQGVRNKWQTDRKRIVNNGRDWVETHDPWNRKLMQDYANSGLVPPDDPTYGPLPVVDPPLQCWELHTDQWLSMYGAMRGFETESHSLEAWRFDTTRAAHAFVVMYTYEMINLNRCYLFPKRFKGRFLDGGELLHVPYVALGMVIGCREQAITIAKLFIALAQRGYFRCLGTWPCRLFILQLLADYLGEPQLPVQGRSLGYPTYMQLAESWRAPDPQAVASLCLAVCDLHTHQAYKQPDGEPGEFTSLQWIYTPIEILLLFKLRQSIGLENPVLDHPLMNTPLGVLPEETAFEPDELVKAVRARMVMDGFDEATIVKRILNDEYADARRKS